MLIFDNRENTGTFSVVLYDKYTVPNTHIYLKLIKGDTLAFIYFHLENESNSDSYKTFSIPTLDLEQGQYRAEIYEGVPLDAETCDISEPTVIVIGTWYECDPATLTATLVADDETVFSDLAEVDELIYSTYARVDGPEYNTVYTTETEYTIYNQ